MKTLSCSSKVTRSHITSEQYYRGMLEDEVLAVVRKIKMQTFLGHKAKTFPSFTVFAARNMA